MGHYDVLVIIAQKDTRHGEARTILGDYSSVSSAPWNLSKTDP